MNTILGLVPRNLWKSDFPSFGWKFCYTPVMQSQYSPSETMSTKELESTVSTPHCPPPPSYNDVSGAVIIGQDGKPQFLSPEEEVERQHRLQQAVREKMLGLPQTTKFEWHHGASGTSTSPISGTTGATGTVEELQLPPYTPREKK